MGVICGIRLDDQKKQHGIKENKEKEGRGISGFPPLQEPNDYTTETKIKPLKKKKKTFFNFDYTVGLVCEYGNKYNL